MADNLNNAEIARRREVFRVAVPYFGRVLPASFFQKTSSILPGIERIHHLIEGIYKPAWSIYPLSMASMLKSPYSDEVH